MHFLNWLQKLYLLYLRNSKLKEYWEDVPTKDFEIYLKGLSLKSKNSYPLEIVAFAILLRLWYSGYSDESIKRPIWLVWGVKLFIYAIGLVILGELYSIYDEKIKNWIQKWI